MNNNQFSHNAISYKELHALLNKAKKEISSIESEGNQQINENKEFNELIKNWTITSKKLLLILNNKDQVSMNNRPPKSLMAYGAMGAHINMALQALNAAEFDA